MECPACAGKLTVRRTEQLNQLSTYRTLICDDCGTQYASMESLQTVKVFNPALLKLEEKPISEMKKFAGFLLHNTKHPEQVPLWQEDN